jgi:hypothetical protein
MAKMAKEMDMTKIWVHDVPKEIREKKPLAIKLMETEGKQMGVLQLSPELQNDRDILDIVKKKAPFILKLVPSELAQEMALEMLLTKNEGGDI